LVEPHGEQIMAEVDYRKPALIGGLIVGFLSLIPFIQAFNICVCLWAWVGGAVAAKLLIANSPQPLTSSDGAKIGLFAGLIGAAIFFLIGTPIAVWQMDRTMEDLSALLTPSEESREILERIEQNPGIKFILLIFTSAIGGLLLLGFTVLGGVLGVALFEKRSNQPQPAPYSGQYSPGYPPNYPPPAPPTAPPTYPSGNPPPSGGQAGEEGG
jgi:hypothetical protein